MGGIMGNFRKCNMVSGKGVPEIFTKIVFHKQVFIWGSGVLGARLDSTC